MKLLIILILATIYGSLAIIIVAAFAHDLVTRGRSRRQESHPQRGTAGRRPDRSRVPLDDADSPILLDDADSPILLDDADSGFLRDDEDAKTARGQGSRPD